MPLRLARAKSANLQVVGSGMQAEAIFIPRFLCAQEPPPAVPPVQAVMGTTVWRIPVERGPHRQADVVLFTTEGYFLLESLGNLPLARGFPWGPWWENRPRNSGRLVCS